MKRTLIALVAVIIASASIFLACSKDDDNKGVTSVDKNIVSEPRINEVIGEIPDGFYYGTIKKEDGSLIKIVDMFENNELVMTWINGEEVCPTCPHPLLKSVVGSKNTSYETEAYVLYDQLCSQYPCVQFIRKTEASLNGFGERVIYTIIYGYFDENGKCFYEQ